MSKIHAIIVAAGSGSRFGGPLPKQFLPLGEMPVVMRAVLALRNAIPDLSDTIVLSESEIVRWESICSTYNFVSPQIAVGGATRFESVRNAITGIPSDTEILLVHDGARPFPSEKTIYNLLKAFDEPLCHGAIPVIPLTDSVRLLTSDGQSEAVDRNKYRAVQTPQAFRAELLRKSYKMAPSPDGFTDDASVMEAAGFSNLTLVEGNSNNIKITNPHDLVVAEAILKGL